MELLTEVEIVRRLDGLEVPQAVPVATRFVKPLRAVGESLVEALRVEDGIGLGLAQIDVLTRGFRPTDLVLITGFAASAKTQLVLTMILNSPEKRVLFLSLDDPSELILAKLVAMHSGMSAERLEQLVRDGEAEATRLVMETAEKHFPNLLIVDDVIPISSMRDAVAEATKLWDDPPDAVVVDYVEVIPNEAADRFEQSTRVKQTINALKAWAKASPYPLIVVHQGTRTNAKPGAPITLLSLGFSGEQQATMVLGVRRKRDDEDLDGYERRRHDDTVTVHVVKNKRPGGRCTHWDGVDFHLASATGLVTPLTAAATATRSQAVQQSLDDFR